MAPEPRVSSRDVLDAVLELRRLGPRRGLQRMEQTEPELASYTLESLSQLHRHLLNLGGPASPTQRTYMRVQSLVLICILAMQRGSSRSTEADTPSDIE